VLVIVRAVCLIGMMFCLLKVTSLDASLKTLMLLALSLAFGDTIGDARQAWR